MTIIAKLQENPVDIPKFSWEHGRLFYKGRLVISASSSLIPSLLQLYHDSVMGGHRDIFELTRGSVENYIGRE